MRPRRSSIRSSCFARGDVRRRRSSTRRPAAPRPTQVIAEAEAQRRSRSSSSPRRSPRARLTSRGCRRTSTALAGALERVTATAPLRDPRRRAAPRRPRAVDAGSTSTVGARRAHRGARPERLGQDDAAARDPRARARSAPERSRRSAKRCAAAATAASATSRSSARCRATPRCAAATSSRSASTATGSACRSRGAATAARVDALIDAVGARDFADRPVGLLSGGEQQRLRVGQALADDPRLLLCDEPLTSLDLANQQAVVGLIDRHRRETRRRRAARDARHQPGAGQGRPHPLPRERALHARHAGRGARSRCAHRPVRRARRSCCARATGSSWSARPTPRSRTTTTSTTTATR